MAYTGPDHRKYTYKGTALECTVYRGWSGSAPSIAVTDFSSYMETVEIPSQIDGILVKEVSLSGSWLSRKR